MVSLIISCSQSRRMKGEGRPGRSYGNEYDGAGARIHSRPEGFHDAIHVQTDGIPVIENLEELSFKAGFGARMAPTYLLWTSELRRLRRHRRCRSSTRHRWC